MLCKNASDPVLGEIFDNCMEEGSEVEREPELYVVLIQFTLIVVLSAICVTGNVTLLTIVCRTKHLRIVSNVLIVNLSVADLLTSLIVLPAFSASLFRPGSVSPGGNGDGAQSACTAIGLVTQLLSMEAISTVGTIALDRYVSICHPLRYQTFVTRPKMAAVVSVTWLQSVVLALLPLTGFGRYRFRSSLLPLCGLDLLSNRAFSFLVLCIVIAPSFLIVGLCYGSIFKAARVQARKIFDAEIANARAQLTPTTATSRHTPIGHHPQRPRSAPNNVHPTVSPLSASTTGVPKRVQTAWRQAAAHATDSGDPEGMWMKAVTKIRKSVKQARAARTVVLIIGGFIGCWAPYVVNLIVTLVRREHIAGYAVNFVVTFLAFSSCLVDPVVCILVNRDFWSAFKTVIGLRRRELIKQAVDAFAVDSTSASLAGQRDRFFSSYSSMNSADAQEWTIFREKWNTLRVAKENSSKRERGEG